MEKLKQDFCPLAGSLKELKTITSNLQNLLLVVPFLPSQIDELSVFLFKHQWFVNKGGHILFKACGNLYADTANEIKRAGCHLIQTVDSGIYDAWNQSLDYLNAQGLDEGAYIAFLGLDDEIQERFCTTVLQISTESDCPDFIFGDSRHVLNGMIIERISPVKPKLFDRSGFLFDVSHPGMMNRWGVISKYRFDLTYKLAADFDFYIGIVMDRKITYKKIPELQAVIGADGMSNRHQAISVYLNEWPLISSSRHVPLDVPTVKFYVFRFLTKLPFLFNSLRRLSWVISAKK